MRAIPIPLGTAEERDGDMKRATYLAALTATVALSVFWPEVLRAILG